MPSSQAAATDTVTITIIDHRPGTASAKNSRRLSEPSIARKPPPRQAASATKSLEFILVGCAITVPAIAGYTVFSYRVFSGKAKELEYA